jgi:hypothetical protein
LKANATSSCTLGSSTTDPFATPAIRKANKCSGTNCLTRHPGDGCGRRRPSGSTLHRRVARAVRRSPEPGSVRVREDGLCTSNADCTVER